jgi:hypothetical protein
MVGMNVMQTSTLAVCARLREVSGPILRASSQGPMAANDADC